MPDLALHLINEAYEKKSPFLDLGNCDLTAIPVEIIKLREFLTHLNLGEAYYDTKEKKRLKSVNNADRNNFNGTSDSFIILMEFTNLSILDLNYCNIGEKNAESISHLSTLNSLDISNNNISDNGAESISKLFDLNSLHISNNNISDKGAESISHLRALNSLRISRNKIGKSGAESISRLYSLNSLEISSNYIGDKGAESISRLSALNSLDISYNKIGYKGAESISRLSALNSLDISYNNIGDKGAESISRLSALNSLDISYNNIGDKGTESLSRFAALNTLYISSNIIGDKGAESISRLSALNSLDISSNSIGDKGAESISRLSALNSLYISNNKIGDKGAESISRLSALNLLYISSNNIGNKGAESISRLSALNSLEIPYNNIGDKGIRILIEKLNQLEYFRATGNKTKQINAELLEDIAALRALLSAVQMVDNTRVKMVLIGNSTAGKTSLAQWLTEKIYIKDKSSTHGIQHWIWNTSSRDKKINVNIWDFGGQDYYHATHEIFLSNETLFLFLKSNEKINGKDDQLLSDSYWMGYVSSCCDADNTPLWHIQTKTDLAENKRQWLSENVMEIFPVEEQCHVSVEKTAEKKEPYKSEFTHFIKKLKARLLTLLQTQIPETWTIIRDEHLPEWRKTELYLRNEKFKRKCLDIFENKIILREDLERSWNGLIPYLSRCGELVVFEDKPSLKGKIFLGAKELTDAMYTILSKEVETKYQGRFTYENVNNIKDGPLLIEVLQSYGLVFEDVNKKGVYVAPQFLPVDPHVEHFQKLIKLSFAIRFTHYMSRSVITNFITKYAAKDKESFFWRYGAFFPLNNVYCFVRIDAIKQIVYVHVEDSLGKYIVMKELFDFFASTQTGLGHKFIRERKDVMSRLKPGEKWDEVISGFEREARLKHVNLSLDGELYASAIEIKQSIENKASRVQAAEGGHVELNAIMHQLLRDGSSVPKRIFFSYSKKDAQYRAELEKHFAALKRSGRIDTWSDVNLEPGQEWDKTIKEELSRADIIMLLLSPDFMATEYIWNIEIPKAIKEGKAVVPIFLRPCDWNEDVYEIDKYYALPAKSDWIVQNAKPNRDESYLKVVEGIKKIL